MVKTILNLKIERFRNASMHDGRMYRARGARKRPVLAVLKIVSLGSSEGTAMRNENLKRYYEGLHQILKKEAGLSLSDGENKPSMTLCQGTSLPK